MRQPCATAREDSTTNAMAIESGTGTTGSVVIEGKRRKASGCNLNFSIKVQIKVQIPVHDYVWYANPESVIQKVNTVNAL